MNETHVSVGEYRFLTERKAILFQAAIGAVCNPPGRHSIVRRRCWWGWIVVVEWIKVGA